MIGKGGPDIPTVRVAAVIHKENKLLLIRMKDDPWRGKWSMPSDFLRSGERIDDIVQRIGREQCGIEVTKEQVIDVLELLIPYRNIQTHLLTLCYLASPQEASSTVADSCKWIDVEDLLGSRSVTEMTAELVKRNETLFRSLHLRSSQTT
jgi:8-oxo-dGTP diphosphatase